MCSAQVKEETAQRAGDTEQSMQPKPAVTEVELLHNPSQPTRAFLQSTHAPIVRSL